MPPADRYDCFLFDMDGVLYRGEEPVGGAEQTIRRLRAAGKGLAFVTNNSSRAPEQVAAKLSSMGIEATAPEVVTSAIATAALLANRGGGRAFVVGEAGIREALTQHGVEVVDRPEAGVEFVVVGWDRSADYEKLKTASLLVQEGAHLVATNADGAYPAPDGLWPGAGALLAVITTTTGTPAEIVGKPHAPLFELARERAGGGTALSIGDRLDTDVAGANRLGWDSLLVFSGVTHPANLVHADDLPTLVGRGPSALFEPAAAVRAASEPDAVAVAAVLRESGLSESPVPPETTWVAEDVDSGTVVGTAALERAGDAGLLRSVAVAPDRRGAGLGALLTAHAVRAARRAEAHEVFLATEAAERFFARLGFASTGSLEALPERLRGFATECDRSAVVMRLGLNPG